MNSHFGRLFLKSNSSFPLQCGNALQSSVTRFREKKFLLDAGLTAPAVCTQDELTRIPANPNARFVNRIGFVDVASGKSRAAARLNKAGFTDVRPAGETPGLKILERLFVNLMAGDPDVKNRAAVRVHEVVGSAGAEAGEWHIIPPQKFRQHRSWMDLNKLWRRNKRVRGFIIDKVKGGYAVAIGGFVAFLPRSFMRNKRIVDNFLIDQIDPKKMNLVVK